MNVTPCVDEGHIRPDCPTHYELYDNDREISSSETSHHLPPLLVESFSSQSTSCSPHPISPPWDQLATLFHSPLPHQDSDGRMSSPWTSYLSRGRNSYDLIQETQMSPHAAASSNSSGCSVVLDGEEDQQPMQTEDDTSLPWYFALSPISSRLSLDARWSHENTKSGIDEEFSYYPRSSSSHRLHGGVATVSESSRSTTSESLDGDEEENDDANTTLHSPSTTTVPTAASAAEVTSAEYFSDFEADGRRKRRRRQLLPPPQRKSQRTGSSRTNCRQRSTHGATIEAKGQGSWDDGGNDDEEEERSCWPHGKDNKKQFNPKITTILAEWMLDNLDYPYPSNEDKRRLAQRAGITPQQVGDWMTNMRKRHLKPVVSGKKAPKIALDFLFLEATKQGVASL